MTELLADLQYALRSLLQRPGFTLIAVLTLTAGIGANTAIFSIVNAVLLRPLPFHDPDRLVSISETHPVLHQIDTPYPDFADWRAGAHAFESLAAFTAQGIQKLSLTGHGEPQQLDGTFVTANLFSLLGIQPMLGRGFLPGEEQPGNDAVAVLSHSLWVDNFASDPAILGRAITLNGNAVRVVGVLPAGSEYPAWADVFLPASRQGAEDMAGRKHHPFEVIGRLKRDAPLDRAQAEVQGISGRLAAAYPATNRLIGAEVLPFREQFVSATRRPLLILAAAVGLILLIACANVANLLVVRGATRRKDMAVRSALGASRGRLARMLLAESLLLAVAGAIPGLLIAAKAGVLARQLAPDNLSLSGGLIDLRVLLFTLLVSLSTAVGFGLLPALAASRIDLNECLTQRGSAPASTRLRQSLVAGEVALAVIVLAGAGLLVRSFGRLLGVDPGFRTDHILTMQLSLTGDRYQNPQQVTDFYARLLPRLRALPGVETAAVSNALPLVPSLAVSRFGIDGQPRPEAGQYPVAQIRVITPDYFPALRIALRQGRGFRAADDNQNLCIINETLAHRFFPGLDPIGRKLLFGVVGLNPSAVPIAGVVADTRESGLNLPAEPEVYFPGESSSASLVIRTKSDPLSLAAAVRAEVLAADREQPVSKIRSMDQVLSESLARRRFAMLLLAGFSGLALLLASIGLYGVLSFTVASRTREIGLRMALGAQTSDVFRLVIGQAIRAVGAGLVCGILASAGASRLMTSQLYETPPADPVTYLMVGALLVAAGLAAALLPAWRAVSVAPLEALRHE